MPATRSHKSSLKGKQPIVTSHPATNYDDVIVISSDDEVPDSMTTQLQKAKEEIRLLKRQLFSKEQASSSQVLSEQSNHQVAKHSSLHSRKSEGERRRLEAQLQQATADVSKLQSSLQLENDMRARESVKITNLKKRARAAESENADLKRVNEELFNHIGGVSSNKELHELEDHILCEICQNRLWHPYILTECGHTLCKTCLIDWFNAAATTNVDEPRYECPKCRTPVYRQPIENFMLKGIVQAIAHAIDPTNVSSPPPQRQNMGREPWFRFFGQ